MTMQGDDGDRIWRYFDDSPDMSHGHRSICISMEFIIIPTVSELLQYLSNCLSDITDT